MKISKLNHKCFDLKKGGASFLTNFTNEKSERNAAE